MTVGSSQAVAETNSAEASSAHPVDIYDAAESFYGTYSALFHADAIVLSKAAASLMRAGLLLRALVFDALHLAHQRIAIAGGHVILVGGIYRSI